MNGKWVEKRAEKRIVKRVRQLWVLSVILLAGGGCQSVERGAPVDTFTKHLDKHVPTAMDWYNIPGISIALVKDGELIWSKSYGYADVEHKKMMSVDAVYRAESISKSVTAWGVMKLVEDGLVKLDTPVEQYLGDWELPESKFGSKGITIRRLLSNSAGIPLGTLGQEYAPFSERPTLAKYLSKEVQLTYRPGSMFEYSNPGYNLLELLIEKVTGRDFNEYMEDEVLLPLGMYSSSYNWNEEWSSRVPTGYDLQGHAVAPYLYPYRASGGLFSTVEDIARFAIAELAPEQQKVLTGGSIQDILSPQINVSGIYGFVAEAYGFGHFVETLQGGKKAVWHGGQGHGWMTHFHLVPETDDGIVLFTNSQRSWPFIAGVLKEWSRWNGYGSVKFSRINTLVAGLWMLTGTIFLFVLYYGRKVIHEFSTGRRRLMFSLHLHSGSRVIEFILWGAVTSVLLWSMLQEYLFLSSIFPVGFSLLAWGSLFMSLVLLLSILFPRFESNRR